MTLDELEPYIAGVLLLIIIGFSVWLNLGAPSLW